MKTEYATVKLTDHDRDQYQERRKRAEQRIGKLAIAKARATAILKSRHDAAAEDVAECRAILREGQHRALAVVTLDFDRRIAIYTHPETGEIVGNRPLEKSELQGRLFELEGSASLRDAAAQATERFDAALDSVLGSGASVSVTAAGRTIKIRAPKDDGAIQ